MKHALPVSMVPLGHALPMLMVPLGHALPVLMIPPGHALPVLMIPLEHALPVLMIPLGHALPLSIDTGEAWHTSVVGICEETLKTFPIPLKEICQGNTVGQQLNSIASTQYLKNHCSSHTANFQQ
jgi:hypothetical protein